MASLVLRSGTLDLSAATFLTSAGPIELTPAELRVLAYLAQRPGTVVSRETLLREALGYAPGVMSRAVDHLLVRLRAKIEVDPANPYNLVAVRGSGVRLVLDASPEAPSREPLVYAGIRVDLDRGEIERDGETLALHADEVAYLTALAEAKGRPVDRGTLARLTGLSADGRALDHLARRVQQKVEPVPAQPRWVLAVSGGGYRLAEEPVLRPGRVRVGGSPFVGRKASFVEVGRRLDAERMLFVVGRGGVGKTRFVEEWTSRQLSDLRWVDLEGVRGDGVDRAMIRALDGGMSATQLGAALRALGGILLVLDGAEQAMDVVEARVPAWIEAAPRLRVLVTSRRRPSLPYIRLDGLPVDEAVSLFTEAARRFRPVLELDDVHTLVERLDHNPLAIEMAAARVGVLSTSELTTRLDGSRAGFGPDGDALLRRVVQWTADVLPAWDRALLVQMSVFASACTLADLEGTGVLAAFPEAPALEAVVADLGRWHLLDTIETGKIRFFPYAAVRAWAESQPDRAEAVRRHSAWFGRLGADIEARACRPGGDALLVDIRAVAGEIERAAEAESGARLSLLAAITEAAGAASAADLIEHTDPADLRAAQLRGRAAFARRDLHASAEWFELASSAPGFIGVIAMIRRTYSLLGARRPEEALMQAERGVAASKGDLVLEAKALEALALAGDPGAALGRQTRAVALHRVGSARRELAHALNRLGNLQADHGNYHHAIASTEEAADFFDGTDTVNWRYAVGGVIAHLICVGRHADALAWIDFTFARARTMGLDLSALYALRAMALALHGDAGAAGAAWRMALSSSVGRQDPVVLANAAESALFLGEFETALALASSVSDFQSVSMQSTAVAWRVIAAARLALGQPDARDALERAVAVEIGTSFVESARREVLWGRIALAAGDREAAIGRLGAAEAANARIAPVGPTELGRDIAGLQAALADGG